MNAMTAPHGDRGVSRAGLAVVVALHLLAFWGLLRMEVFLLPAPLALLEVSLLAQPLPEAPPKPAIVPPKPRPVEKRPAPRPVRETAPLALPVDAPLAAAAPPVELPTVPPEPTFVPPAPTQPRFDADYLDNPRPVYPALARRLGEQGRVLLRVHVAADGLPLDVELQTGSGSPRLDQAAIDTVRRWKFVPARLGGEAIVATVLVPIVFSLKD